MRRASITEVERFWNKVSKSGEQECWLWTGSLAKSGYGAFMTSEKKVGHAHRIAWKFERGEIPAGAFVCHHCDTPACVNPAHLFLGSPNDNVQDMMRKGRYRAPQNLPKGERHYLAKLTEDGVRWALAECAAGRSAYSVAKKLGVTPPTITKILRGESWKHVTRPEGEEPPNSIPDHSEH